MKKGIVTLLVPTYNLADYLPRLLDSILYQTYPDIEVLVFNDGSTDHTTRVVTSYFGKYKNRGYNISLINQENVGQAETINNGLKKVEGEFLAWPDSDDWYASPYAIEKLVTALIEGGPEVGVSRCAYQRIDEETGHCIEISHPLYSGKATNIFDDAVMNKPGFWLEPGGWMVKTEILDKIIPGRNIYTSRLTGQNSQILWPYLYYSKCVAIDEPLYCYLIRKNSHSHGLYKDYEKKILQQNEYGKTFYAVIDAIKDISDNDKQSYHQFISERINSQILPIAIQYKKGKDIRRCIKRKFENHSYIPVRMGDYLNYILSYCPVAILYKQKVANKIRKVASNVGKHKGQSILFTFLLLFFFIISFILISPKIAKKWYEWSYVSPKYVNADEMEARILSGANILLNEEFSSDETIMYYRTVKEYITRCINKSDVRVFEYGEYGYLLYYTYLYAKEKKDIHLMNRLKDLFDQGIFNCSSIEIKRNDQIAYGCFAIEMAKKYKENPLYASFCSQLLARIDSMEKADGIVLYHEGDLHQHVDGIGLVCPFLEHYGKAFDNNHSMKIARNMCEDYVLYGVDHLNGLPAQAYHTKTKVKNYRANWGRGTSWFLLGIMNLDSLSIEAKSIVEKTDSTLLSLGPLYTQYIGVQDDSEFDMSSTIPILFYLHNKGLINMTRESFAKLIAPYVDESGIIRFNSPSISRPDEKPNAFQSHFLSQGLALYLFSILR